MINDLHWARQVVDNCGECRADTRTVGELVRALTDLGHSISVVLQVEPGGFIPIETYLGHSDIGDTARSHGLMWMNTVIHLSAVLQVRWAEAWGE